MLIACEQCSAIVDAEVVSSYINSEHEYAPTSRYSLLRCPVCRGPMLAREEEDWSKEDAWEAPARLYPPVARSNATLPKAIRVAFDEAVACLQAKAFTASAIMCRKTLEGVCDAHGAREGNLAKSLQKLRDDGTIDSRLFEWANALRIFGNEAAHGVHVVIAPQDASDTVDFTRALLEYVFTFHERFQEFQKRRGASPGTATT